MTQGSLWHPQEPNWVQMYVGLGLCIPEISTKMRLASHTWLHFTHGCDSLESPLTYFKFILILYNWHEAIINLLFISLTHIAEWEYYRRKVPGVGDMKLFWCSPPDNSAVCQQFQNFQCNLEVSQLVSEQTYSGWKLKLQDCNPTMLKLKLKFFIATIWHST